MKRCSRCGIEKDPSEFYKNKYKNDGLEQYCKECSKDYRKTVRNYEKSAASTKAWGERNPQRVLELHARREARKIQGFVEDVDTATVWQRGQGKCGICGEPITLEETYVDHITPLARGGEHSYANTQPAHELCNLQKGSSLGQ
jgi:5-methylcytosine-specific restriction endonuclease McrA